MNLLDFIVFFIYIILFYIVFAWRRRKLKDPLLKKYHRQGFWIKVFSCFAYCMFILHFSPGDSNGLYHKEGYNIYQLILSDSSNIKLLFSAGKDFDQALLANIYNAGYFGEESNYMVTRIVAMLSFITFGRFLAISLIFSMISFTGVWRLYRFFYEQYPQLHKQFAIAILYLPTFVFWSSGILKDPLCTGALGWITYSLYAILFKKNNTLFYIPVLLFFSYLLAVLKIYILVSYIPFLALFLILKNVSLVTNKFLKIILIVAFIGGPVLIFISFPDLMQKALGNFARTGVTHTIQNYQASYVHQYDDTNSGFSLGKEFDGTIQSLIAISPYAIVATLYRPFLWESKKLSTLLSALESLALMLFTLYVLIKTGIKNFTKTILNKPIVTYTLIFSIIFALFIGATTQNFGTLVRYKIPAIPFYIIGLFFILFFNNKLKAKPDMVNAGPVVSELSVIKD